LPGPTNHAARRWEVARAAVHSIARDGLEGAILRAVADEGGWSVGVVQHYFRNKSELLAAAVEYLADRTSAVLTDSAAGVTALQRLTNVLDTIVPQPGSQQAKYWRVWVCFWAQATNGPVLASAVEEQAQLWRQRLTGVILAGQADGSIRDDLVAEDEAAYMAAVIDGMGVTAAGDTRAPIVPKAVERLVQPLSAERPAIPVRGRRAPKMRGAGLVSSAVAGDRSAEASSA
jgi:DNA-binding transcriptional regulator YbjK